MKPDAPVNKESAVYKAILEEEAAKSQPRGGAPFGSHYQQPQGQPVGQPGGQSVGQPSTAVGFAGQPTGSASAQPIYAQPTRDDLRASPTLQSHSFRRLQQVLGDNGESSGFQN